MAGRGGVIWLGMSMTRTPDAVMRPSTPRKVAGWGLIGLGVLGCVLPILQGFLFLALGVFVLRDQHHWAARRWGWIANRWPGAVGRVERAERALVDRARAARARVRGLFGRG